ncbi:THAP domain-containing protein 1-like [Saccostrea cucullata]|uniref:THAP domain-containing protein 1-like n=1 Tax=Saccostrea cuccullata TaxID=36930 RepID=UPI002ED390D4
MSAAEEEGKGHDKHFCVLFCNGNGRLNPDLSFQRIPKAPEKRKEWIQAIRRDPGPLFTISDQTVVCFRHFKKEDIKWTPVRTTLKPGSVPSVFSWKADTNSRRPIVKHTLPEKRPKQEFEDHVLRPEEMDSRMLVIMSVSSPPPDEIHEKNKRIQELENLLQKRDEEIKTLQQKIEVERFGIQRLKCGLMAQDLGVRFNIMFLLLVERS